MEGHLESFSASTNSTFVSLSTLQALSKCWLTTKDIILSVQPSVSTERRRKDVVRNIRNRIIHHFGCEVFVFGSMPLKTYIPDGDIDLTVVTNRIVDDLATDIFNMLQRESQHDTEFKVKNLKLIPAQVKILKCMVQDISIDISFNQMAGLCALCFFEQVDRAIGQSHLFKESLILVKAWCYYESRILGAHHGLISTYALETLVLFIINIFHASINGPLAVLYKFLSYFSTFEWDKNGITLNGAVPISSIQTVSVNMPENVEDQQLLHRDFIRTCKSIFLAPPNASGSGKLPFPIKDMNIVDPLNDNNNLGRSVSTCNLHRIKCALTYGAEKLEEILGLPGMTMHEELMMFFATTLDRNGRGVRPDLPDPSPVFGYRYCEPYDLTGDGDTSLDTLHLFKWHLVNTQQVNQEAPTKEHNYFHPNWQFPADEMGYSHLNQQFALAGYDLGDNMLNETDMSFRVNNWENFRNLPSVDFNPHRPPYDSLERVHHSFGNMHLGESRGISQSSYGGVLGKASQHTGRIQQTVPSTTDEGLQDLMPSKSKSSSSSLGGSGPCTVVDQSSQPKQEIESSADKIRSEQYRLIDNEDFPPLSNLVDTSKKTNKAKGHK